MPDNSPKNIALLGYGSMGREIEREAPKYGLNVTQIFDVDRPLTRDAQFNFDVAIDFSTAEAVATNARLLALRNIPIVVGTTGWLGWSEEVFDIINNSNSALIYGSNFSIGMQLFFKIAERAAELFSKADGYDVLIHELHHKRKKDAPSGTALKLAEIIQESFKKKTETLIDSPIGAIEPTALHVTPSRGGEFPGTHTVYFDSSADTIELVHRARNRSGFAAGALVAAKWICGRKGVWTFEEMLDNMF
ncbi:MAG: 4-hydroxy-tetrahydrodipicolinate reductase [Chloroflexota bacterium]